MAGPITKEQALAAIQLFESIEFWTETSDIATYGGSVVLVAVNGEKERRVFLPKEVATAFLNEKIGSARAKLLAMGFSVD